VADGPGGSSLFGFRVIHGFAGTRRALDISRARHTVNWIIWAFGGTILGHLFFFCWSEGHTCATIV